MHVLIDVLPSVPQRGAPLASVLASRKLKPKWEARRLERQRMKHAELRARREGSEEDSEGYSWESCKEGSVA